MRFVYPHHIFHRLQQWQLGAKPSEIGWVGICAPDTAGDIVAQDVYLYPRQTVTGATFTVTADDTAALYGRLNNDVEVAVNAAPSNESEA